MGKQYRVIMPPAAKQSLREIVEYIKKDSPSAASKVRKRLFEVVGSLNKLPERFSKEILLDQKNGNYRSVTIWHFKIVYQILENEVLILKFIHTSINPSKLKQLIRKDG